MNANEVMCHIATLDRLRRLAMDNAYQCYERDNPFGYGMHRSAQIGYQELIGIFSRAEFRLDKAIVRDPHLP